MSGVIVFVTDADRPPGHSRHVVAMSDLVLLKHYDGSWSIFKDRDGRSAHRQPWDRLPSDIKRRIPLYPASNR